MISRIRLPGASGDRVVLALAAAIALLVGLLITRSPVAAVGPVAADLDELVVPDAAALRAWLVEHAATSPGVWLALTR